MSTLGTVKWFNDVKGYGYIHADGEDRDIFAHWSAIEGEGFKTLAEGQRVEFERIEGPKGDQAMQIRRVLE